MVNFIIQRVGNMDDHILKATKSFENEVRMTKWAFHKKKLGRKKNCIAWNKGKKKGEKSEFTY